MILAVLQWETFDNFPRMRTVPGVARQRVCQAAHKMWTDCELSLQSRPPISEWQQFGLLNEGLRWSQSRYVITHCRQWIHSKGFGSANKSCALNWRKLLRTPWTEMRITYILSSVSPPTPHVTGCNTEWSIFISISVAERVTAQGILPVRTACWNALSVRMWIGFSWIRTRSVAGSCNSEINRMSYAECTKVSFCRRLQTLRKKILPPSSDGSRISTTGTELTDYLSDYRLHQESPLHVVR